jgi:hypothetical protein
MAHSFILCKCFLQKFKKWYIPPASPHPRPKHGRTDGFIQGIGDNSWDKQLN